MRGASKIRRERESDRDASRERRTVAPGQEARRRHPAGGLADDAPGHPVVARPVVVAQLRHGHAAAGRGVDKLAVGEVDADVAHAAAAEKDEVARLELVRARPARPRSAGRRSCAGARRRGCSRTYCCTNAEQSMPRRLVPPQRYGMPEPAGARRRAGSGRAAPAASCWRTTSAKRPSGRGSSRGGPASGAWGWCGRGSGGPGGGGGRPSPGRPCRALGRRSWPWLRLGSGRQRSRRWRPSWRRRRRSGSRRGVGSFAWTGGTRGGFEAWPKLAVSE